MGTTRAAPTKRRERATESFKSAADCLGTIHAGMSVFAITRGQWSMVDAVLHCIEACAPAKVSLWTWTVADYEIQTFSTLAGDGRISAGTLVIDQRARAKNMPLIQAWQRRFGASSVRWVVNHAKIATVEGRGLRLCLRGSMNLNHNPRFEQLDITEGDGAFDLVREIEAELPVLPDTCGMEDAYKASKVGKAFEPEQLAMFSGVKRWAK